MTTRPLLIDMLDVVREAPLKQASQPEVLSVTALSFALKNMVEQNFSCVRLKGEISGLKKATSGHLYFALKDEQSVLDAICWKGSVSKLGIIPEEGLEVVCVGKITTYPNRSKYQIIVETMEVAGQGALLKLLEERRKKLEAEGIFDASKKKKIPFLPNVIGVITSPTGAVIRDIMHRLEERFPRPVLLWPSLMQGENSAQQVALAIKGFNAFPKEGLKTKDGVLPRPDVLIVARGGGSLEDLWAFNEECVVRAVYESDIPVISAIGHETDTTLIDYVSDLRAPTPTGAAEKAVPVKSELRAQILDLQTRLMNVSERFLKEQTNVLASLSRALPSLTQIVEEQQQRLDDRTERLDNALNVYKIQKTKGLESVASRLIRPDFLHEQAKNKLLQTSFPLESLMTSFLKESENRFQTSSRLLDSFSYERTLERGFALVLSQEGKLLSRAEEAKKQPEMTLKFFDDLIEVEQKKKNDKIVRKTRKKMDDPQQGQLL